MKFDKDFNPGQGNTYNEWNIEHVENLNPAATTVTTTHHHYGEEKVADGGCKRLDDEQKEALRADILAYVGRLTNCVKQEWKSKYATLWKKILALPEVDTKIYYPGRQKNTTFNRQLVGNIIKLLIGKVLEGNPTSLATALEGTGGHSVRTDMGKDAPEEIRKAVSQLLV